MITVIFDKQLNTPVFCFVHKLPDFIPYFADNACIVCIEVEAKQKIKNEIKTYGTIRFTGQVVQAARRLATSWTARVRSRAAEGWRFFFCPSYQDWPSQPPLK